MIKVHVTLVVTLRQFGGHKAILLLGVGIADKTLLRLEVKCHRVCLIGV